MKRGPPDDDEASVAEQLAILRELKQQPAAVLIGWTPRGLRDSSAPRKKDGNYDGPKLVAWILEREGQKSGPADPDDIFAGGDSSPNLERCRAEKARELKRNNDKAEGLLIETETVGKIIDEVGRVWRDRVKNLQQVYGEEIGEQIASMVDDAFGGMKDGFDRAVKAKEPA